ncbi:toll/interleukin-1 receptor domain-containing protein [Pseudomonas reactans]|uniref:Toll/interleukin-1 receptor domain-containing protein n=1 Tax=Pseudomonas reactans TaxID=117680 RepID=A0ABX2QST4_9PSED|nr:toll/interleukin-1 receptor domain-containing protein [Pseudomonas reactans]NWA44903.1 toll/interleukin-1 receptor domain-containing protein [Pseudomonas reactans]NWD94365.1 toll/interleukin-1 receptor domain-containing protein [Pseudomonas reactans]
MSFFTQDEARAAAKQAKGNRNIKAVITESMESYKEADSFDIFLSHSSSDANLVIGIKKLLEQRGKRVYVDWVDDPELDRSRVTKDTAARLRHRMVQSESLFYVATDNATNSKWMPWELGFFDGLKHDKVRILPVLLSANQRFDGQEYLGLYPVVSKEELEVRSSTVDLRAALRFRQSPGLFPRGGIGKPRF